MNKRFDIELGVFLHELSKNTFDCDGFDSLDFRHREHIRNMVVNRIEGIVSNLRLYSDHFESTPIRSYFENELNRINESINKIEL